MRGCGSGHYSTLTRAHIHLNLWVLPGPVPRPIKTGFYPTHYGYFLQVPIRHGSNCHPYIRLLYAPCMLPCQRSTLTEKNKGIDLSFSFFFREGIDFS